MTRTAGVLLHPTSLPGGTLDHEVIRFLDWMSDAGLRLWQMLPLGVPHDDRSPYQSLSCHALNPALLPAEQEAIDDAEYRRFVDEQQWWLDDYAFFVVLRGLFNKKSWSEWPEPLRFRDTHALAAIRERHHNELEALKKEQYRLFLRWEQVREAAHRRGITLFGDVPIAVAYDSVDVWANPELFKLDENLQPTVVAGVPPDYFSETGQRWGNPHYNWQLMERSGFHWWRQRIAMALTKVDLLRIDHFRGLEALWEIPAAAETAIDGTWVKTPGRALLETLRQDFPHMPFVAEDLGVITEDVVALRDDFDLPGLSVLQFGFDGMADNPHRIDNQVENSVVYTGTHDNNTTRGWFESLDEKLQQQVIAELPTDAGDMPWPVIVAALQSPAERAMVPMQDWLGLNEQHRLNTPGTVEGNWNWHFGWDQVAPTLAATIRDWLNRCDRL
ncbi:4-alpha-glucanotransferase [Desulfuromonas acetoxidans]|uniref:4-alpha-glucanotransferase n=1 Tax=Desulfuromonas acetoxidans (strain DSM 684 / 11070) TaxID=281689 RepID=Q1JYB7_DESA6|nr:4-alpha-glucanotransferase [Desulfuromonas acetoxidans]EAT15289.1 4-alpha-glucanotransferase [Desulfuromonas acetoxidans DSM 684]MBF0645326.1 4-alpha-glucanotransferase [Desulfuromonas acetoxidans]NVD23405.1 4-alpha-glucanotransferase [Desulfuromonas acetoxidans]NVE15354.1 4-alpha-glucanotransferase [Desulfuromonas acetoxidans]